MIYWTAAAPIYGLVGLFITGLGISSLYSLILSLAIGYGAKRHPNGQGSRQRPGNTVRASSFSSLASGVAIFSLPLILGRLADAVGIRSAYSIIILLLVVAFVIIRGMTRFTLGNKTLREIYPSYSFLVFAGQTR